jgi:aminoglycoside phosphotransferase (APT) family kinase protein
MLFGEGRRGLQEMLQSIAGPNRGIRSIRLRRAKFKPGRKLTASYDVALGGVAHPAPVTVTWYADGAPPVAAQLAEAQRELRDDGAFTGFDRLWAFDADAGMVIMVAPLDPAFRALGRFSDPINAPAILALCDSPDGDRPNRYTVRPIRYRPGKRHVLEHRGPSGQRAFVKLYRDGTAAQVAVAVTTFAEQLERAGVHGATAVRPAAVMADADALLFRPVAGTPLSRSLRGDESAEPGRLHDVGRLMRAVHSVVPDAAWRLRERELDSETSAVLRACEAMVGLRPELGVIAVRVVERAREGLEALAPEPATVVHGDLKADHLLLNRDGIAILDTDRSALADPALDIGKLLADLRWWSWVRDQPGTAAEAELLAGYRPANGRLARAELYAALWLVKMAARRVPVASRDWARRTASLLQLTERAVSAQAVR